MFERVTEPPARPRPIPARRLDCEGAIVVPGDRTGRLSRRGIVDLHSISSAAAGQCFLGLDFPSHVLPPRPRIAYDSPKPPPWAAIEKLGEWERPKPHEGQLEGRQTVINCHELIEFCMDYIEGDLPEDEELGFRRHLSQCSDCVTFFETYRKTPELSREALHEQIPASVKESVRSFLASRR